MEIITLAAGGMAYKDIGAILDLSVAAVKVRIHRARIKLRTLLNNRVG
jgi:DNA-directed RNA polymerase specialized sigma24 family protein